MIFQLEKAQDVFEEMQPLLQLHYEEIAHYKDIELKPDKEFYFNAEDQGRLRVFTVRDDNILVGYSVYFLKHNPHYKDSLQASQDVVFIRKDKRGQGREFVKWCDEQLKEMGVDVVYHHVKAAFNWGPMLEKQGYKLIDHIYGKRL